MSAALIVDVDWMNPKHGQDLQRLGSKDTSLTQSKEPRCFGKRRSRKQSVLHDR